MMKKEELRKEIELAGPHKDLRVDSDLVEELFGGIEQPGQHLQTPVMRVDENLRSWCAPFCYFHYDRLQFKCVFRLKVVDVK